MSYDRGRYQTVVRVTHEPTGREACVRGGWHASERKLRQQAIALLLSRAWRDQNDPADMTHEVACYDLPDDDPCPHDLREYRIGPEIGAAQRPPVWRHRR